MTCECQVCRYGREVEKHLVGLTPEQRAFFEDMYERLCCTELDCDVNEAIIDGTWTSADEIIAQKRAKIKQDAAQQETVDVG